jgi:DNA-binding transcriptional MocR family regulator
MANTQKLKIVLESAQKRYEDFKSEGLNLNMTRGKPGPEQLDLAGQVIEALSKEDFKSEDNSDCRNYGGLNGIPEAQKLFADYMDVKQENIMVGGNSSLSIMHDHVVQALLKGVPGGLKPWKDEPKVTFLCPVPGYDRHFNLCQHFGIEMIPVQLNDNGPDMDQVEKLVAKDSSIKGIWCVPKYSNPTGSVYSDDTVKRLSQMKTAAPDFRIFWDNAYAVHFLEDGPAPLANLLTLCEKASNANRALMFGSTSKISFAGAGVGVIAASIENLDAYRKNISLQTIGPDKLNQLRHVRFFKDYNGIIEHMNKHAKILKPKFDKVNDVLTKELSDLDIITWTKPKGGYFVSLNVPNNCAQDVVELAKKAGVQFTGAGATFPLQKDPNNSNIRLAPSLPSLPEIEKAMQVLSVCIIIITAKKEGLI